MASEIMYYSDKDLQVAGDRITMRGTVYPLGEVQSVRVWQARSGARRERPYVLLIAGAMLVFTLFNLSNLRTDDWLNTIPAILTVDLLFGVFVLGVLLMGVFLKDERVHMLGLRGTFGNSVSLPCDDERHAQRMMDAARMAIVNFEASAGEYLDMSVLAPGAF